MVNISSSLNKKYVLNIHNTFNKKKWLLFYKIYFLRKNGMYNNFFTYLEKIININSIKSRIQISEYNEVSDYVINYYDSFFSIMKSLRYTFRQVFLKNSKKLSKIYIYLKKKKIVSHPNKLNLESLKYNNKNKNFFFSLTLPIVIVKKTPIIINKWKFFNFSTVNKISKLYYLGDNTIFLKYMNYLFFYNSINNNSNHWVENDYSVGSSICLLEGSGKVYNYINNSKNFFWPIFIKMLHWRVYAT